jgi:hypothetical protein
MAPFDNGAKQHVLSRMFCTASPVGRDLWGISCGTFSWRLGREGAVNKDWLIDGDFQILRPV